MKTRYVAVEREYGSGGTAIARLLAEKCDIPCYGREILKAVSEKYGISVDSIERYEETATGSFLYSIFALARSQMVDSDMLTAEGHIFVAEQEIIRSLAAQGSAIFLGHCASEAFHDSSKVIKVFIRGNPDDKRRRIIEEYGIPEHQADSTMRRFDKKRANYYYANTLNRWDDMHNYNIVLDSSTLGITGCVSMLRCLFN